MVKRHAKNNAFITNKWLYAFDQNTKTKATRSSLKQTHVLKFKASQHHHLENFLLSLSLFQFPTKWKNYRITKSVTYKRYCCYNVQRMLPRNMDRELVLFSNILLNNNNNNNKSLNFKMNKMRSSRGLLFRLID